MYFLSVLKIQRTFRFFDGFARDAVGINHCSPHIGVPEQLLDRADIIVRLKQMRGE
jgi:hypothetical protein